MRHLDKCVLNAAAFAAASLCPAASLAQGKVFYTREPTLGVSVLAPEMNEWQTPPMHATGAKHPTARRTLSMLVRSGGRDSVMLFHDNPFRFDVTSCGKGLRPGITVFRVKPGREGRLSVGPGEGEAVPAGRWHHVCFTVDPDGYAALWIDGSLVDAKELKDWKGLSPSLGDGTLLGTRPTVADGLEETDFAISRFTYREGVMDWRDIQREADEWLGGVGRGSRDDGDL